MFRKTKIATALFVALFGGTSCNVFDIENVNSLSTENAFYSAATTEAYVLGLYENLKDGNGDLGQFLGARSIIWGDLLGEDFRPYLFSGDAVVLYQQLATDPNVAALWDAGYDAVNAANFVLENVDRAPVSDELKTQYRAEARFVRGLANFVLATYYAPAYDPTTASSQLGIILRTTYQSNTSTRSQGRASLQETFDSIVADLTAAANDLPAEQFTVSNPPSTRATSGAAWALLSRVHLHRRDYAAVLVAKDRVTGYSLTADPIDALNWAGNSELIFSLANSNADNPNTNDALPLVFSAASAVRDYSIDTLNFLAPRASGEPVSKIPGFNPAVDERIDWFVQQDNRFWIAKYNAVEGRDDDSPVIRYAEVLLNSAEAQVLQSGTPTVSTQAIDLLNEVRVRSNAAPYSAADFANGLQLLSAIVNERRVEFAGEGLRYWDIKRLAFLADNDDDDDIDDGLENVGLDALRRKREGLGGEIPTTITTQLLTWPIPLSEIERNPALAGQQNPGY